MSARHAVLSIGTILVLGLGVYLLVAVRADPAAGPPVVAERAGSPTAQVASPPDEPAAAPTAASRTRPPAWVPSHPGAPPPVEAPPPAPAPAPAVASPPSAPAGGSDELTGPRLELVMDEANKAYDRGDYDEAKAVAVRVLGREPSNVRMLRILVSASCIDGDSATAISSFARLPAADQAQMRTRCARYGIAFPEK